MYLINSFEFEMVIKASHKLVKLSLQLSRLLFFPAAPCRSKMSADPVLQPSLGHQQAPCFGSDPFPHPTPECAPDYLIVLLDIPSSPL